MCMNLKGILPYIRTKFRNVTKNRNISREHSVKCNLECSDFNTFECSTQFGYRVAGNPYVLHATCYSVARHLDL